MPGYIAYFRKDIRQRLQPTANLNGWRQFNFEINAYERL